MTTIEELKTMYLPFEVKIPKEKSRKFNNNAPDATKVHFSENEETIKTISNWIKYLKSRIVFTDNSVPY